MSIRPIREHVEDFISEPDTNGCRLWTRGCNGEGRALFNNGQGSSTLVSRFLLEKKLGRKLKKDELACHTCDNPKCCNINHIWLGTNKANMADKVKKARQWRPVGEKHHRVKLTEKQVRKILKDQRPYIEIAPDYEVSKSLVGMIKRREIWTHVSEVEGYRRK